MARVSDYDDELRLLLRMPEFDEDHLPMAASVPDGKGNSKYILYNFDVRPTEVSGLARLSERFKQAHEVGKWKKSEIRMIQPGSGAEYELALASVPNKVPKPR